MPFPRRGEIWLANLDPTIGREIKKTRPAVVIQNDTYNRSSPLTIVVPITSSQVHLDDTRVQVLPPEGGLSRPSVILTAQVRAIDRTRLVRRLGKLSPETMIKVDQALKIAQGLQ